MKRPTRGAPAAQPTAAPERVYPVQQIHIGQLIEDLTEEQLLKLLIERIGDAADLYANEWASYQHARKTAMQSGRHNDAPQGFRATEIYQHPLHNGNWANRFENTDATVIRPQLERALKASDWQEVMMCAGMLCVRDMLYGRKVEAKKPAPTPKAKAASKVAKKKPAAKKPASTAREKAVVRAAVRKHVSDTEKLAALVERARPLFKANPDLDRVGLIKAIGRGYERLTTLDELRTLCAGKTVTQHSVKPKRERRDPPPPAPSGAAQLASEADKAAATEVLRKAQAEAAAAKPWPKPDSTGYYNPAEAEHAIEFKAGGVNAKFSALSTEGGWTTSYQVGVALGDDRHKITERLLHKDGPLDANANAAIRECAIDMLDQVKALLKAAEAPLTDEDHLLHQHTAELEKLRAWLLGFQARGVEKIEHLKKAQQGEQRQMELAA